MRLFNRFDHYERTSFNIFLSGIKRSGDDHIAGGKSRLHRIRLNSVCGDNIRTDKLIQYKN